MRVMSVELDVISSNSETFSNYKDTVKELGNRLYKMTEIMESEFSLRIPSKKKIMKDAEETVELKRMYSL